MSGLSLILHLVVCDVQNNHISLNACRFTVDINERTMCGDDDALASLHVRSDVLQPVRHHAVQSGLIQNEKATKEWLLILVWLKLHIVGWYLKTLGSNLSSLGNIRVLGVVRGVHGRVQTHIRGRNVCGQNKMTE